MIDRGVLQRESAFPEIVILALLPGLLFDVVATKSDAIDREASTQIDSCEGGIARLGNPAKLVAVTAVIEELDGVVGSVDVAGIKTVDRKGGGSRPSSQIPRVERATVSDSLQPRAAGSRQATKKPQLGRLRCEFFERSGANLCHAARGSPADVARVARAKLDLRRARLPFCRRAGHQQHAADKHLDVGGSGAIGGHAEFSAQVHDFGSRLFDGE